MVELERAVDLIVVTGGVWMFGGATTRAECMREVSLADGLGIRGVCVGDGAGGVQGRLGETKGGKAGRREGTRGRGTVPWECGRGCV